MMCLYSRMPCLISGKPLKCRAVGLITYHLGQLLIHIQFKYGNI
jgi:hypothetical protein